MHKPRRENVQQVAESRQGHAMELSHTVGPGDIALARPCPPDSWESSLWHGRDGNPMAEG